MATIERTDDRLPYNGLVLRWARERRRLRREDAARRASVTPEKIAEWERGAAVPTVRQARQLASLYDRPFLEFFSPTFPEVPPLSLAPDYRFLRAGPSSVELGALEGVQEWAESQRLNALDLYEVLGEAPPRFPVELRSSINDPPEEIAELARKTINFPIEDQLRLKYKERPQLPSMLRKAIESVAVLVLKQSGLLKARTRGICLYNDVIPVIVFGKEAPGGQAFTLAHEFGHVVIGASALSGAPIIAHRNGSDRRRIEGWCNSFAAAFLMPAIAVASHPRSPRVRSEDISDADLSALADAFAVSRHAMLIRLTTLSLVDANYYWRIKRKEFLAQEASFETRGGPPKYYGSRFRNTLGDHYTSLVLEALGTNRIGYHTASEFMGIKNVRHLVDIRDNFGT